MSRKRIGVGTQHPDLGDFIDLLRSGDESALDKIFDPEFKAVQYGALTGRFQVAELDIAWPLAREVVGRYLRRGGEPTENFNPWFHRILRHLAERVSQPAAASSPDLAERDRLRHLAERISHEFTAAEGEAVRDYLLSEYLESGRPTEPRHRSPAATKALSRAEPALPAKAQRIVATMRLVLDVRRPNASRPFCVTLAALVADHDTPLPEDVWRQVRRHVDAAPCTECASRKIAPVPLQKRDDVDRLRPFCPTLRALVTGPPAQLSEEVWQHVRRHVNTAPCTDCAAHEATLLPLDSLTVDQLRPIWQEVADQLGTTPKTTPPAAAVPAVAAPAAAAPATAAPAAAPATAGPAAVPAAPTPHLANAGKATRIVLRRKALAAAGAAALIGGAAAIALRPDASAGQAPATAQAPHTAPAGTPDSTADAASATTAPHASDDPGTGPGASGGVDGNQPPAGPGPVPATAPPAHRPTSPTPKPGPATTAPGAQPPAGPPPDLAGSWSMAFRRTNFGSSQPQLYTITLSRLADSACVGDPPCWGGRWWNPDAHRYDGSANISLTPAGDKVWHFSDVEGPDYPQRGKQFYQGRTVKNAEPMTFSGDFRQQAPDVPTTDGTDILKATFDLTRSS